MPAATAMVYGKAAPVFGPNHPPSHVPPVTCALNLSRTKFCLFKPRWGGGTPPPVAAAMGLSKSEPVQLAPTSDTQSRMLARICFEQPPYLLPKCWPNQLTRPG